MVLVISLKELYTNKYCNKEKNSDILNFIIFKKSIFNFFFKCEKKKPEMPAVIFILIQLDSSAMILPVYKKHLCLSLSYQ